MSMCFQSKQKFHSKRVQYFLVLVAVVLFSASGVAGASAPAPSLTVRSDTQLQEDRRVEGDLLMLGGTLDLNGYSLTVSGSLHQHAGIVNVKEGSLTVLGDYRIQGAPEEKDAAFENSQGWLIMTGENDAVHVHGDFAIQSVHNHSGRLTKGVLEVKGDFSQRGGNAHNFNASGTHKVVLSGEKRQSVSFEHPGQSGFSVCEIPNDKVFFLTAIRGWKLQSDTAINLPEEKSFPGFTGTVDLNGKSLTVRGSFVSEHAGVLNLSAGKLIVEGDFLQPLGTVNVKDGSLTVLGDYRIQGAPEEKDAAFENSQGWLIMTGENDAVHVHGDFAIQSVHNHSGRLTKGVLEVKGDFSQRGGNVHNFNASGTHKVVLSGEKRQSVSFEHPGQSGFQILVVLNREGRGIDSSAGYRAHYERSFVLDPTHLRLNPGETVRVEVGGGRPDEHFTWLALDEEVAFVSEDVVRAVGVGETQIRISSSAEPNLFFYSQVIVGEKEKESAEDSHANADAPRTLVSEKSSLERALLLAKEAFDDEEAKRFEDALLKYRESLGLFHIPEVAEHEKRLEQFIESFSFPSPSLSLEAEAPSPAATVSADTLLQEDLRIEGDLLMTGGTLDLNGHSLTISGSFYQYAGRVNLAGGTLVVLGDYRMRNIPGKIESSAEKPAGALILNDEKGTVLVRGVFLIHSLPADFVRLTKSVLEMTGDFTRTEKWDGFPSRPDLQLLRKRIALFEELLAGVETIEQLIVSPERKPDAPSVPESPDFREELTEESADWRSYPDHEEEKAAIEKCLEEFRSALKASDIPRAAKSIAEERREEYAALFAHMPEAMPSFAEILEGMEMSFLAAAERADPAATTNLRTSEYAVEIDGFTFYIRWIKVDDQWALYDF